MKDRFIAFLFCKSYSETCDKIACVDIVVLVSGMIFLAQECADLLFIERHCKTQRRLSIGENVIQVRNRLRQA